MRTTRASRVQAGSPGFLPLTITGEDYSDCGGGQSWWFGSQLHSAERHKGPRVEQCLTLNAALSAGVVRVSFGFPPAPPHTAPAHSGAFEFGPFSHSTFCFSYNQAEEKKRNGEWTQTSIEAFKECKGGIDGSALCIVLQGSAASTMTAARARFSVPKASEQSPALCLWCHI